MGALWTRLWGKQTTYEILESIDKDINRLQKNRKDTQERLKRFVTRLIIYSVVLYVIGAVVFFFLYLPDTWQLCFLYSLPLLVFPFLIWGLKKMLNWYFVQRIAKNDVALRELRERKKQILEDVMETETYKKAKEILEKFDPARFKKLEVEASPNSPPGQGTPGTSLQHRTAPRSTQQPIQTPTRAPAPIPSRTVRPPPQPPRPTPQPMRQPTPQLLRQPAPASTPQHMGSYSATPMMRTPGPAGRGTPQAQRMPMSTPHGAGRGMMMPAGFVPPPGPPMPRSVLPRDRGTMDRLMDYLVGDGPENRYALICQQCSSHNGMALKEEFEYLSFRCCYCFYMNPARKQRPFAPRMEFFTPLSRGQVPPGGKLPTADESDEEDEDEEESEEEEQGMTGPASDQTRRGSKSSSQAGASGTGSAATGKGPGVTSAANRGQQQPQRQQGQESRSSGGSSAPNAPKSGIPKVASTMASKGHGQASQAAADVAKTTKPASAAGKDQQGTAAASAGGAQSAESRLPLSQSAAGKTQSSSGGGARPRTDSQTKPAVAAAPNSKLPEVTGTGSGSSGSSQIPRSQAGRGETTLSSDVSSPASTSNGVAQRSQIPSKVGAKVTQESRMNPATSAAVSSAVVAAQSVEVSSVSSGGTDNDLEESSSTSSNSGWDLVSSESPDASLVTAVEGPHHHGTIMSQTTSDSSNTEDGYRGDISEQLQPPLSGDMAEVPDEQISGATS